VLGFTREREAQYIFDVALTSTGIVVRDNALPQRSDEQRQLPLSPMIFGEEVSLSRFIVISQPLCAWNNEPTFRSASYMFMNRHRYHRG
jgi:hypothetical protein